MAAVAGSCREARSGGGAPGGAAPSDRKEGRAPGAGLITPLPNGVQGGPDRKGSPTREPRKLPGASRRSIPFK